jgi:hypothetical protein
MLLLLIKRLKVKHPSPVVTWRRFVELFSGTFAIGLSLIFAFVLLIDPYGDVPFSLPLKRRLIDANQRFMYPQVVRSGLFDSLVIGNSTSKLLDPVILNEEFGVRFANLSMDAATAWEQKTIANYFIDHAGRPKVIIVGVDDTWCVSNADTQRITARGFPYFLYDDDKWNDFFFLFNSRTVEMAGKLVGVNLGLYSEVSRFDGYYVFVPPENTYDLEKARRAIWGNRSRTLPDPNEKPFEMLDEQRESLVYPALNWLDALLLRTGDAVKVIGFMPAHVAVQPDPATPAGAHAAECKSRIVQIARRRGAKVIDWRYSSPLTREDSNYWDSIHYRVPVANSLAHAIGFAIREGKPSADGIYRLLAQ